MLTKVKSGAVWQIPVMPPPKHTVLAATTTAPATTISLRYYEYYHGTGFGKASKTEVRNFRGPIKALMQGDANHEKRRPQTSRSGTKEVHAHGAHLDMRTFFCACCADQPPKRV